jgi:hypothetical protein
MNLRTNAPLPHDIVRLNVASPRVDAGSLLGGDETHPASFLASCPCFHVWTALTLLCIFISFSITSCPHHLHRPDM